MHVLERVVLTTDHDSIYPCLVYVLGRVAYFFLFCSFLSLALIILVTIIYGLFICILCHWLYSCSYWFMYIDSDPLQSCLEVHISLYLIFVSLSSMLCIGIILPIYDLIISNLFFLPIATTIQLKCYVIADSVHLCLSPPVRMPLLSPHWSTVCQWVSQMCLVGNINLQCFLLETYH